jgi:hypothetical protein
VAVAFFGAASNASAVTGAAVGTQTNLPAGILIGDESGIHVDSNGHYFIDARGLRPGDVVRRTLTLQNLSHDDKSPEGKVPYHLTMTAEPLSTKGPVDLLEKVDLSLVLDGRTIYQGPSRGNGSPNMIERAQDLGEFGVGDRSTLNVVLTVDPAMRLSSKKSEADFRWHFYAYRAQSKEGPKTGIWEKYGLLFPLGCVLLLGALLLPLKKRRDDRMAASEE